VSRRPLALVSVLAIGDYLLWNWSLNGNHDVLALASGLTLPPLAIACLWLLAFSLVRLIADTAHRSRSRVRDADGVRARRGVREASAAVDLVEDEQASISARKASSPSSGKLAA
jgi:hypothetical protein